MINKIHDALGNITLAEGKASIDMIDAISNILAKRDLINEYSNDDIFESISVFQESTIPSVFDSIDIPYTEWDCHRIYDLFTDNNLYMESSGVGLLERPTSEEIKTSSTIESDYPVLSDKELIDFRNKQFSTNPYKDKIIADLIVTAYNASHDAKQDSATVSSASIDKRTISQNKLANYHKKHLNVLRAIKEIQKSKTDTYSVEIMNDTTGRDQNKKPCAIVYFNIKLPKTVLTQRLYDILRYRSLIDKYRIELRKHKPTSQEYKDLKKEEMRVSTKYNTLNPDERTERPIMIRKETLMEDRDNKANYSKWQISFHIPTKRPNGTDPADIKVTTEINNLGKPIRLSQYINDKSATGKNAAKRLIDQFAL